uniref:Uncharacterized protein n=1 Tax=Arundo donax TaxID=35708 RepID=A0A0A9AD83_ARUDO
MLDGSSVRTSLQQLDRLASDVK